MIISDLTLFVLVFLQIRYHEDFEKKKGGGDLPHHQPGNPGQGIPLTHKHTWLRTSDFLSLLVLFIDQSDDRYHDCCPPNKRRVTLRRAAGTLCLRVYVRRSSRWKQRLICRKQPLTFQKLSYKSKDLHDSIPLEVARFAFNPSLAVSHIRHFCLSERRALPVHFSLSFLPCLYLALSLPQAVWAHRPGC